MKRSVTPKQVARAIGVSEASLKRWCDKGLIPVARTAGGHRRLPVAGVLQFLRRTGHQLVKPELLDLPPLTGAGATSLRRGQQEFRNALEKGDAQQARRVAMNLYLGGHSVCEICDQVMAHAFHEIGDRWQHGSVEVYQERRGCEICMRVLYELESATAPPNAAEAALAASATLEGDPYYLPVTMIEATLCEGGWRAESFGIGHPAETLIALIRDRSPRMLCVSVSTFDDRSKLLAQMHDIYEAAAQAGTALVVGGRALTDDIRRELDYSAYCDSMRHLSAFAMTLQFPAPDTLES